MASSAASPAPQPQPVTPGCMHRNNRRSSKRLSAYNKTQKFKRATMIDIKVPAVGESISEVTLVKWLKQEGQYVERDEVIAELESEKATFEINAEKAGVLKTVGKEGDTLKIGEVVAQIDEAANRPEGQAAPATPAAPAKPAAPAPSASKTPASDGSEHSHPAVVAPPAHAVPGDIKATPVAAAMITDKKIDAGSITPTGTRGKI